MRIPFLANRAPRVFIPARQTVGGPATFLRNLKTYLDALDYAYSSAYRRGDSIFFPIRHKTTVLDKVKRHGGQIIQRLDGVYGDDQPARRARLARVYHDYADWVVYQTEWCKRACEAQLARARRRNTASFQTALTVRCFIRPRSRGTAAVRLSLSSPAASRIPRC